MKLATKYASLFSGLTLAAALVGCGETTEEKKDDASTMKPADTGAMKGPETTMPPVSPGTEAPKVDAPTPPPVEAPKTEAPKADAPAPPPVEAPKTEAPKADAPAPPPVEAPKTEAPKA